MFDVLAHESVQSLEDVERTAAVAGAAAALTCIAVEAAVLVFCVAQWETLRDMCIRRPQPMAGGARRRRMVGPFWSRDRWRKAVETIALAED